MTRRYCLWWPRLCSLSTNSMSI